MAGMALRLNILLIGPYNCSLPKRFSRSEFPSRFLVQCIEIIRHVQELFYGNFSLLKIDGCLHRSYYGAVVLVPLMKENSGPDSGIGRFSNI